MYCFGKNYFWEYFILGKAVVWKNGSGNLTPNPAVRLKCNGFLWGREVGMNSMF